MTILWCGGEDVDFPNGDSLATNYSAYDANLARYSFTASSTSAFAKSTVFHGGEITSGWFSFLVHAATGAVFNCVLGGLGKSGSNNCIVVGLSSGGWDTAKISLYKYNGSSYTSLGESTSSINRNTFYKIDIDVQDYGDSSAINVYVDGNLYVSFSGDSSITDCTGFDAVFILAHSGDYGGVYHSVSEIFVADEDTLLMRLKTIAPSAAGDTSANWTGAYTDVDETTISDSDKIYTATDNADFQCNLTGMPSGTWSVKAIKVAARCVDGSGATGIQLGVKSGGTVDPGDTQSASGYWQTKERLMTVNPVTGVAFTPAEIDALQINLRAKAL